MAAQGRGEPLLTYVTAQKEKRMKIFLKGSEGLEGKTQRQHQSIPSLHKMYTVMESYCNSTIH